MELRGEVLRTERGGRQSTQTAVTVEEAVRKWREWYRESRQTWAVFQHQDEARQKAVQLRNRFMPEADERRYAKLKDLERGVRESYGRRLHTVLLSLTGSSTFEDGTPRPPVDHLHDLGESWSAVRRALHRVLDGRRWEYLAIPDQHDSGYIHWHVAVFVDGEVEAEDFRPVIEAHVRNCPIAKAEAHEIDPPDPEKSGAAEVRRDISNLSAYLSKYIGGYGEGPLQEPIERQVMYALLWATGKRRWRPSDGAQRYMALDGSNPGEWELLGVQVGPDGELREVDSGGGGGRRKYPTWGYDPGRDRPPTPPPS